MDARARTNLAAFFQKQGALVVLAALAILATARYEAFATPENVINVLRQNTMVALVSLGMTFVILTGGIDLSVGSLLAVGGVVAAVVSPSGSVLAIVAGVLAAALLGLVNGLVVTKARIPPFIATLSMMFGARGLLFALTHEDSMRVARSADALKWLGRGYLGPVPVPVVILVLAFGVGWLVLGQTRFGRHVFAVGDNAEAARLMGLDTARVTTSVYVVSGALSGLAGVLLASRVGAGQPVAGQGWELTAITSVVVGGTLLTGGQGGALSTLVGVLLMGVIFNVFNLEGTVSSYWQFVLRGVFLVVVVVVQKRLAAQIARGVAAPAH